ncbi:MAG TPA: zinc-ribbon domain-containing protein [Phototrophicaceae bacterium]|jgi:hypothetical protein|nr:zinc-ribbon domain-containing protein [Phototrophicaceae bacterium]
MMRFIFVFGMNNKQKVVGTGEFECPHCQTIRLYERKEVRSHISLYFIPLIPVGKAHEIVECTFCHRAFSADVLSQTKVKGKRQPPTLAEMLNTIEPRLVGGEPADYLIRDLTTNGLDFTVAADLVGRYLKPEYHFCETCGLSYNNRVTNCTECGGNLILKTAKNG